MKNRVSTSKFEARGATPNEHSVAVVGARGYSGVELTRILLRHPLAKVAGCFATSEFRLSDYLSESAAKNVPCLAIGRLFESIVEKTVQTVFLATPVETSLELAPKLLKAGVNVIDLSGAYRLQQGSEVERTAVYKKWYGVEHSELDLLSRAEFGLVPWIGEISPNDAEACSDLSAGPRLIANPGCFSTAVLLGILPLLKAGLIDASSLVIDAKSGTSGAGRKAEERLLHCEVEGACLPYRIGRHQHEPEIQQYAMRFAEKEIAPFFTTHLLPVRRGIVASMYARLAPDLTKTKKGSETAAATIEETFASAYGRDPLIEFASLDRDGGERLLNLRRVVGTARTQIAYRVVDDRLYLFSLIDNLLKGAASQAVENFNRMIGVPTWTALSEMGGVL